MHGNVIYKRNKSNGISYTFEYSALNQLTKATVTSTPLNGNVLKIIEFKYDPVCRRILRQVTDNVDSSKSKTQKFYYDGDNIIAELDADNNLTASYTHSPLRPDDVLGAKFTSAAVANNLAASAGYVYYLKDHLNTVNEIVNGAGEIVQKMDYSAFGVLRSVKDGSGAEVSFENAPVRPSFTYTGREFEPELNMYYYRARYYDPSTGRFLQQDPDPGKLISPITFLSKYIYTGNNPINFSDSTGRDFFSDLGKALTIVAIVVAAVYTGGAIFGAVSSSIGSYVAGSSIVTSIWGYGATAAAIGTVTGAIVGGVAAIAAGATVGTIIGATGYGLTAELSGGKFADGARQGAEIGFVLGGIAGGIGAAFGIGFAETPGSFGAFVANYPYIFVTPAALLPFTGEFKFGFECGVQNPKDIIFGSKSCR